MALIDELKQYKKIVVLTGAGVSVPSGIPDYRSKDGLYTQGNPEYLLSHKCLEEEPDKFYEFIKNNMIFPNAKPNAIHEGLALLDTVTDVTIITQNVDGLHQKAGSESVIEFHGSINDIICEECEAEHSLKEYLISKECSCCGGKLRPEVVLYDECISEMSQGAAINAIARADLIMIIGTSMQVYPFAALPQFNFSAKVIVINKEKLDLPYATAEYTIDAEEIFKEVVECLKKE